MTKKQEKIITEEVEEMEFWYESLYNLPDEWLKECGLIDEWGRPYCYLAYPRKEIKAKFYSNN